MLPMRNIDGIGVSISTAMALSRFFKESIKNDDRDLKKVDINEYDFLVINSFTLIRNIITAYESDIKNDILTKNSLYMSELMEIILDELFILQGIFNSFKTDVILFLPDYTKVKKQLFTKPGKPTQKDLIFNLSHLITQQLMIEQLPIDSYSEDFKLFKRKEPFLILTHLPIDLLNYHSNPQMELLESHTGKIKTKDTFNTKYQKRGKDSLEHLPFDEIILYILGDNNFIHPQSLVTRRSLLETSEKYNWTKFTTQRKISVNLKSNKKVSDVIINLKRLY